MTAALSLQKAHTFFFGLRVVGLGIAELRRRFGQSEVGEEVAGVGVRTAARR
jgi:hypothetical protein